MAPKAPALDPKVGEEGSRLKRANKGFNVGPQNLPDGVHRRKVQKIKHDLIRKAKVKKEYGKLKEREETNSTKSNYNPLNAIEEKALSLELHPDRQAMVDEPESTVSQHTFPKEQPRQGRQIRQKPAPFEKQAQLAQERREERESQQREYDENRREHQAKLDERQRFRKAMAKARSGGKDGQRKLGRESKVLLEKVQRIVAG